MDIVKHPVKEEHIDEEYVDHGPSHATEPSPREVDQKNGDNKKSLDSPDSDSEDEGETTVPKTSGRASQLESLEVSQFLCIFCPKSFSVNSLKGLSSHISEKHADKIYCKMCKSTDFKTQLECEKHGAACKRLQPLFKKIEFAECTYCKHLYRSDKLKDHALKVHNIDISVPQKISGDQIVTKIKTEPPEVVNQNTVSSGLKLNFSSLKRKLELSLKKEDDDDDEKEMKIPS